MLGWIDRNFVAVLYTSDSDKLMRYTDEGETFELCRWTVDLGSLPGFQQHANNPPPGGFYTGKSIQLCWFLEANLTFRYHNRFRTWVGVGQRWYEIAFSLFIPFVAEPYFTEVRGVLLYNGYECGRVTFDFLI
jgi:hypothetical protein